jgi:HK97 family phage major capsid protein
MRVFLCPEKHIMPTLLELKDLIESQGRAWEEHKRTNDEILQAKADGKAIGLLEEKLAKVGGKLDELSELKTAFEETMLKMNRPGSEDETKGADELKSFNLALESDCKRKGASFSALDANQYGSYKSGFIKIVRGANFQHLSDSEQKAMIAGSDPDGGYLLPATTHGRMVAKIYEQSVMRQICDVQTISTAKICGIVDNDEASAGWVSEIGTRDDTDTPQVGKWEIEAFEMYAQPKASQTVIDDAAVDVESWLAEKVADKFGRVEGTAFWGGTGVGQPRGLASYATAATADGSRAWGTFEHIVTGANGDFHTTKADPLQDLLGAFKDQYLQNASFVMRRAVRTKLRKLKEATSDRYLWEPGLQAGQPDRLLGYPTRIDEYMPTLATNSLSLAFGDFREAYTIVDRIGIRTLRDPYTAKPYVRFYSTKRTGGGAVNFEAVKFIKFSA